MSSRTRIIVEFDSTDIDDGRFDTLMTVIEALVKDWNPQVRWEPISARTFAVCAHCDRTILLHDGTWQTPQGDPACYVKGVHQPLVDSIRPSWEA